MRKTITSAALAGALAANGCAVAPRTAHYETGVTPSLVEALVFVTKAGTNRNRPIRATLTRTADGAAVLRLLATENTAWFASEKNRFASDFPESITEEFELVPGTVIGPIPVASDRRRANLLFCEAQGTSAPIPIEEDGVVRIALDEEGCTIESTTPPQSESWLQRLNPLQWDIWPGSAE